MLSDIIAGVPMPLASMEGTIGVLIPVFALLIPIVAILTKHQMKMAALIHGRTVDANDNIILTNNTDGHSQLTEEVRQLRELMHQQAIALDNLRDEVRASHSVQDRINQNS
jgi:hypothetical protein